MDQELKLNEFKAIHRTLSWGIPWLDHLLLGLLYEIEQWYLRQKVVTEVDRALKEYEDTEILTPVSPVYSEQYIESSTSLPEMRISAPWYIDEVEDH